MATYVYRNDRFGKAQLGFIIDDKPSEFAIADDSQHVNLYGYTSLTLAAVQAQAREIAALKKEIKLLKDTLRQRAQ